MVVRVDQSYMPFRVIYEFAGSPWGTGTITGSDGSRQPSKLELQMAETQGSAFYQLLARHKFD